MSIMTLAPGQPSSREFPHQVLVPADSVQGHAFTQVFAFHEHAGVPIKNFSAQDMRPLSRIFSGCCQRSQQKNAYADRRSIV
jgi:hypothetical protein